ncbi:MAG: PrgI family protein [Patescibacteria group bacterium]
MSQFQVPQFIETEPKIVGPLTLKQFMYVGVAGLLSFFMFFTLRLELWLILTVIMGLIACAFAFLKYNGRPFEVFFMNAALYIWKPKLYLWQRKDAQPSMPGIPKMPRMQASPGLPATSKIRATWLSLVTKRAGPIPQIAPNPAQASQAVTPIQTPIVHEVFGADKAKQTSLTPLRNMLSKKDKGIIK